MQHFVGGMIAALEVHELLSRIHDIMDNAVSKWVTNMACILVCLFDSFSRQHCEVWASQFPFFTVLRILFLPVRLAFTDVSTGP